MQNYLFYITVLLALCFTQEIVSQELSKEQTELLNKQKIEIEKIEKQLLKIEIAEINSRLEKNEITKEEATLLKKRAAKKRALNIQNKNVILKNQIEIFERNKTDSIDFNDKFSWDYDWNESYSWLKNRIAKSINKGSLSSKKIKYDRRTYSSFVLADGLNYVSTNGSLKDFQSSNFQSIVFYELGWQWRTRILKKSNFLRFNYGLSLQVNPIEQRYNVHYVLNDGKAVLQEFESQLKKSTFKRINLVAPIYLEFGPSKVSTTENSIRYSIKNQLRFGLGAYAGINLSTKQKLRYFENGVRTELKQINQFNTKKAIYGLSAYAGIGGFLLYAKWDLNPIFNDTDIKYRNVSFGLRTDL